MTYIRALLKRILGDKISAYLLNQVYRTRAFRLSHIRDSILLRYHLVLLRTAEQGAARRAKPHILFVTEKWCEGNPDFGPSNDEHNFSGSLEVSDLATQDRFLVDEYCLQNRRPFDTALLLKCIESNPDLVFISWYRSPKFKTLKLIRERLQIPIVLWCGDSVNHMEEIELFLPFVDLSVVVDSTTAYLQATHQPEKYMPMWTPQDTRIYYNPDMHRDIDVCFVGTMTGHPDRLAGISALRSNGIDVYQIGGQREHRLPVAEYARIYMRSKIALNFCYHPNLAAQYKGRVFEATLCGAMLLETENSETAHWFEPMVDYVPFKDEADLVEKVKYYLSHDTERTDIAARGHQKAKEKYTGELFWKTVFKRVPQ